MLPIQEKSSMADMEEKQPSEVAAPSGETITTPLHELPVRKASDFTMVYANNAHFATSPWDLTLIFGQSITLDPHDMYIEQRVAITLSPQTAKAVAEFLLHNLMGYEQQFGQIRYTPLQQPTENPSA
jgi:hypothetical protein